MDQAGVTFGLSGFDPVLFGSSLFASGYDKVWFGDLADLPYLELVYVLGGLLDLSIWVFALLLIDGQFFFVLGSLCGAFAAENNSLGREFIVLSMPVPFGFHVSTSGGGFIASDSTPEKHLRMGGW